jgi:putative chitinase
MCVSGSVGNGGHNDQGDTRRIQLLLNFNSGQCGLDKPMVADGRWGPGTAAALQRYQRAAGTRESGLVEPGDATLAAFHRTLPPGLPREKLWATMATAELSVIDRYFPQLSECLTRNGIDTPLRIAHFLAQVGHESADLRYPEEIASGQAYEGRADLGNTEPGDGQRFKGRGLMQLTGRTNYARYGAARQRDFLSGDNPKLIASDPGLAVDVAGWFWATQNLNNWADADDVETVTKKINGGYNGLDDRKARLACAKWFLLG